MAPLVYALCALTACVCAWLLLRGYFSGGSRLLLWSGLCFAGLTLNNLLVFIDLVVIPEADLSHLRHAMALAASAILLYGLIWDVR
ncbi:MAG: hypothetical protein HY699_21030 [Deltaproteobacteria bacterium]|nr:hypothetical protein [Deltaproteobacteria bacterium]